MVLADPGRASGTVGCWVCTSPSGYVTAFGEAGVPTPGLEQGGVGCNPRSTFDGKVQIWGYVSSNSIPPYLRTTEPTSSRQPTVPATKTLHFQSPPSRPPDWRGYFPLAVWSMLFVLLLGPPTDQNCVYFLFLSV